jgi:hypothetical protein
VDGRSRHCSGRNWGGSRCRCHSEGQCRRPYRPRGSIGKTAGWWEALETRWKVLWTAAAVVVVLGCVGIATEALNEGGH